MQNTKTPVMVLQELTVKKGFAPPDYQIVSCKSGTHENRFDFVVSVAGIEAEGSGSSKQIGKHEAAHNALMQLKEMGIYDPSENPVTAFQAALKNTDSTFKSTVNCIEIVGVNEVGEPEKKKFRLGGIEANLDPLANLQNICVENKLPPPIFNEISCVGPPHAREFTYECKIASLRTEAKGNSKKMAKQLVAKEMLEKITGVLPELAAQLEEHHNTLTDLDSKALLRYSDFQDVIPDKSIKVDHMSHTFKKLMAQKNLTYKDHFEHYFEEPSEDNLKELLGKLELRYEIDTLQTTPLLITLCINTDTSPFTVISAGSTEMNAKEALLKQTFQIIQCFMQIPI